MKRAGSWSLASGRLALANLLGFALGLALFTAGLAWIWPPLGLIGAGVVLMGAGLFGGGRNE